METILLSWFSCNPLKTTCNDRSTSSIRAAGVGAKGRIGVLRTRLRQDLHLKLHSIRQFDESGVQLVDRLCDVTDRLRCEHIIIGQEVRNQVDLK